MTNCVPERISGERAEKLRNLSDDLYREYAERWTGKETEVIIEGSEEISGKAYLKGLSDNYLKVIFPVDEYIPGKYDGRRALVKLGKEDGLKEGYFYSKLVNLYI